MFIKLQEKSESQIQRDAKDKLHGKDHVGHWGQMIWVRVFYSYNKEPALQDMTDREAKLEKAGNTEVLATNLEALRAEHCHFSQEFECMSLFAFCFNKAHHMSNLKSFLALCSLLAGEKALWPHV